MELDEVLAYKKRVENELKELIEFRDLTLKQIESEKLGTPIVKTEIVFKKAKLNKVSSREQKEIIAQKSRIRGEVMELIKLKEGAEIEYKKESEKLKKIKESIAKEQNGYVLKINEINEQLYKLKEEKKEYANNLQEKERLLNEREKTLDLELEGLNKEHQKCNEYLKEYLEVKDEFIRKCEIISSKEKELDTEILKLEGLKEQEADKLYELEVLKKDIEKNINALQREKNDFEKKNKELNLRIEAENIRDAEITKSWEELRKEYNHFYSRQKTLQAAWQEAKNKGII